MPNSPDPEPSIFTTVASAIRKRIKALKRRGENENNLRETLEELIEEHEEDGSPIESEEKELLGNVLNLRDLTAEDVMVPRVDIIAVSQDVAEDELINLFVKHRVQRVPVYKTTLDEITGAIQVQDLLAWKASGKPLNVKSLVREVLFVSPTMRTLDLIFQMRERGIHMAFVVDEYGGIDGLVTFSNLIEEIIGDIQDAQDSSEPEIIKKGDGTFIADGKVLLEEIDENYDLDLLIEDLEDEIETIGGLVTSLAGHMPACGEIIKHPNKKYEFEVIDADLRRVKRVSIKVLG